MASLCAHPRLGSAWEHDILLVLSCTGPLILLRKDTTFTRNEHVSPSTNFHTFIHEILIHVPIALPRNEGSS